MTQLFGWVGTTWPEDDLLPRMAYALRSHPEHTWGQWSLAGFQVGILEQTAQGPLQTRCAPARDANGRYSLWMAGEAFSGGTLLTISDVTFTRTLTFRRTLLEALLKRGFDAIREIDGEYHIAIWDSQQRSLTLLNDRFGGLPLYWCVNPQGFAFAGGVRGILTAPGVSAKPDIEAIREAVSFGGFRLGDRTNIEGVKMLPGASVVTVHERMPKFRRYWHWAQIRRQPNRPIGEVIEEADALWKRAIRTRLGDAR